MFFADAEQCRNSINISSYSFVALTDIGNLLFVLIWYHHFSIMEDTVGEVTKVEPVGKKCQLRLPHKGSWRDEGEAKGCRPTYLQTGGVIKPGLGYLMHLFIGWEFST